VRSQTVRPAVNRQPASGVPKGRLSRARLEWILAEQAAAHHDRKGSGVPEPSESLMITRLCLGGLAALVAVATGAAVAWWGGAVLAAGWGGTLVDTGWTPWLLPASRLLVDASAVVTVGFMLAATFLAPGRPDSRPLL